MSVIQLLHGTDHIIEVPDIHIGNPHNDYGMGFYCTRVDEMAREWACKKNTDGFVNSYDFDTEGLKVLNLLDGTHTVLNWMALLLQFRTFKLDSEVAVDARDYLIDHYSIDLTGYDVVIGYRADDSYFQYAESFVSNTLPLRSLNKALKLGKLGEQTVVISQKGFDRLHFVNAYPVSKSVYYPNGVSASRLRMYCLRWQSFFNSLLTFSLHSMKMIESSSLQASNFPKTISRFLPSSVSLHAAYWR